MWVLFTAYCENPKRIKAITRFCESQAHANMVDKAFKNMLTEKGYNVDFIAHEFCQFNIVASYECMKFDIKSLQAYINSNPCDYGRYNDIGCNRLHQYL